MAGAYRPVVNLGDLEGPDGSPDRIVAKVTAALRFYEHEKVIPAGAAERFRAEARAGDYRHLLETVDQYVIALVLER